MRKNMVFVRERRNFIFKRSSLSVRLNEVLGYMNEVACVAQHSNLHHATLLMPR
jgi:hypothetical protein